MVARRCEPMFTVVKNDDMSRFSWWWARLLVCSGEGWPLFLSFDKLHLANVVGLLTFDV